MLRQQNNRMVDNLIDKVNKKTSKQIHDNKKVQQHQEQTKIFLSKVYTKINKVTYSLGYYIQEVQSKDLGPSTAIHSYPSAKVQDLSNIVKQYNGYHEIENLIIHVGHNNINSGNTGFETVSILMETASEIIKKLSPLKVALYKIPLVKDGFFNRSKNNENIEKYNEALKILQRSTVAFLILRLFFINIILETKNISNDGVHPSISLGMPKLVRNIRNFYVHLGLTVSETEIKPRIINRNFGKNFDHYDNNNFFFASIQNNHFYLQLIINLDDELLNYRTMRLFLMFLIFSILMGRENHTEIQMRTFEKFYSNKPNVCYFLKQLVHIFLFSS